jgi:nucleoside-diphosphate-sugar epimerase
VQAVMTADLVLTGTTGFIGSHLKIAAQNGGFKLFEITRNQVLSPLGDLVDHNNDPTIVAAAIKTARNPVFINLAALFVSTHTSQDISPLVRSNVEFSALVFEAAALVKSSGLLHFGTSWQFSEGGQTDPVNFYAATKVAAESILKFYSKQYNIPAATIVMYDTYGPNDMRQKIIPLLLETSKSGQELKMGSGKNPINLTFITDVCSAILCAAIAIENQPKGYHCRWAIRNPKTHFVYDVVELIRQKIDHNIKIRFGTLPGGAPPKSLCHSIQVVPNWAPTISLEQGLRLIFEDKR